MKFLSLPSEVFSNVLIKLKIFSFDFLISFISDEIFITNFFKSLIFVLRSFNLAIRVGYKNLIKVQFKLLNIYKYLLNFLWEKIS